VTAVEILSVNFCSTTFNGGLIRWTDLWCPFSAVQQLRVVVRTVADIMRSEMMKWSPLFVDRCECTDEQLAVTDKRSCTIYLLITARRTFPSTRLYSSLSLHVFGQRLEAFPAGPITAFHCGVSTIQTPSTNFTSYLHILLYFYSPYNMVAQANNTWTSKNTTNKKQKK